MGGGVLGFSKSGMSSRTRGGQSRLLGRHGGRQGRRDVGDVKKFGDGFGKQELESPEKVLFFKYETMKQEPVLYVKRLAEFVGQPFSAEEESEGVVDQIIKLCSFQHLSSLEIKKTAQLQEPNASSLKFVVNKRFWVDIWLNFNAYEVNLVVNY
ncbi:hypothetical protein COP2_032986 [Malus domestica]